jgi:endogenous inhibitor of DNA gyrase (YacG/DUF329 family)
MPVDGPKDSPQDGPKDTGAPKPPKPCPVCGKPADPATLPFCSKRCRDVDLNRWLSGRYVIPGRPTDEEDAE